MSYNQRGFKWYVVNMQTLSIDSGWSKIHDATDRATELKNEGLSPGAVKVMTKPRVGSLVLDPNDDASWSPKRRNPAGVDSSVRSPTSTSSDVRSPTSTSSEVRSPTSTSTDAYTSGNITVTGGAGAGATNVTIRGAQHERGDTRRGTRPTRVQRATDLNLDSLGGRHSPPKRATNLDLDRLNPDGSEEEITGTHRAQRVRGVACPEIGTYVKRRKSAHMYRVTGCDGIEVEVEDVGAGGIERFRVSEFAKLFTDGSNPRLGNPAGVVKTPRDERLWEEAKESAAQQGRANDWPYVMGIFMRMKKRTGGLRENPGELVIVNPASEELDSAKAEKVFEMWHKKEPNHVGVIDTGLDGDDTMVCVGNAHDIVYRSGKWERGKKTNDYVHTFDSKPKVWMLRHLVEPLVKNPGGGKQKTVASLLAQAKNADGQFAVADLAKPLSFGLDDGTDEGMDIAIHSGARVYGAVDQKTVIIVDPKWMLIVVKGGKMYFDERGIVK